MTATPRPDYAAGASQAGTVRTADASGDGRWIDGFATRVLALLRIAFGLTFLWAFFDKLLALGFATGRSVDPESGAETLDRFGPAAWINGGSPTEGFLTFGAKGPFKELYNSMAGAWWADWLFMAGLLGIGIALTFGIFMRIGCIAGAILYFLMWTVALPPENHPFLDDHILGTISLIALMATNAGETWGLGRTKAAQSNPWIH
jgi:thiosulfate dehydrogenase [quinone] large subunit